MYACVYVCACKVDSLSSRVGNEKRDEIVCEAKDKKSTRSLDATTTAYYDRRPFYICLAGGVGGFAMFIFLSMSYNQMSLLYYSRKCNGIQITLLICIIPIPLSSSAGCLQRERKNGKRAPAGTKVLQVAVIRHCVTNAPQFHSPTSTIAETKRGKTIE